MENFNLELEGKVDQRQILQANLAALKQKNNQLTSKITEFELQVKILNEEKLAIEEASQESKHLSSDILRSHFFQKLWRSKKRNTPDSEENVDVKSDGNNHKYYTNRLTQILTCFYNVVTHNTQYTV
jgi:neutral trehalase